MTGLLAHVDLVSPDGEKLSVHDGAGWGQGETAGQEGDGFRRTHGAKSC